MYERIRDKKPPVMTNDTARKKVDEEVNVVPDIDDEAPWHADELPMRVSPCKNAKTKSKPKTKVASTSSGSRKRGHKKNLRHSSEC